MKPFRQQFVFHFFLVLAAASFFLRCFFTLFFWAGCWGFAGLALAPPGLLPPPFRVCAILECVVLVFRLTWMCLIPYTGEYALRGA